MLLIASAVSAQVAGKIDLVQMNYKKEGASDKLTLLNLYSGKGTPADYGRPALSYKLEIISSDNEVLRIVLFKVPAQALLFKGLADDVKGTSSDLNFTLYLPYFENAVLMNIYDTSGRKVLSVPVIRNPGEQPAVQQPKEIVLPDYRWMYVAGPIVLILGLLFYVEVKRKKDHAKLMIKQRNDKAEILRNYVGKYIKKGYSKGQIRSSLAKYHYSPSEIEESFKGTK